MNLLSLSFLFLLPLVSSTIIQNGQLGRTVFPSTAIAKIVDNSAWKTYPPNATEIAYKGRWDKKFISCNSPLNRLCLALTENRLVVSLGELSHLPCNSNLDRSAPGLKFGFTGDKVYDPIDIHLSELIDARLPSRLGHRRRPEYL
jgi:hypothetical protein